MGFVSSILRQLGLKKSKTRAPVEREAALRNLADARDILKGLGMRYWITDGTLLGFYREGDFLGHDKDIDLGCLIEEYRDDLVKAFQSRNWQITHVFGTRKCGLELSFEKEGVKMDLFFFYREGDRLWHAAWRRTDKKLRNMIKYYYDDFDLREETFLGETFSIPADTLKYVSTKYGENWRTPVKEWDWAFGPSNAVATEICLPRIKVKKPSDLVIP